MKSFSTQSDSFYALTTLRKRENDASIIEYKKIGIFKTIKEIHNIFQLDIGDISEAGFFSWALIEECSYGLYMYSNYEEWWTHDGGIWIPYEDGDHLTPLRFLGNYRWIEI